MVRLHLRFLLGVALAVLAICTSPPLAAQQSDLNDQLQLFNSLSPDQQQQILQQLGLTPGGIAGQNGATGSGSPFGTGSFGLGSQLNPSQAALLQQQQLLQQRRAQAQSEAQGPSNALEPGDWVLIDLTLPPPPPVETPASMGPPSAVPAANTNTSSQTSLPMSATQLSQLSQSGILNPSALGISTQIAQQPAISSQELSADERSRLQSLVDLIHAHNPYELDSNGELLLPGIPPMALAGLNEELATRRVAAEPAFEHFQVRLTRLPLRKFGNEALKPFGYELFDNPTLGLLPSLSVPVPSDYVMGPGDVLQVQLYGNQNRTLSLTVARDGEIAIPQIGPLEVNGRRYSDVKAEIEERVARQIIGTRANVSVGETRTIDIFVLGAAKYPGSYAVSGLATVTTALFAAGGIEKTGSLRDIQVKRQGRTVRTLDLYDLLMRGDSSGDIKLLPGDAVFIPPVGPTVSLDGEVLRPAIYELKGAQSVTDLIRMGGGLTPAADRDSAALTRIDSDQHRVVMDIDPSAASSSLIPMRNGDALQIERLRPQIDSGVTLQGYVYQPRSFAWRQGLRLSDIIQNVDELKPDADQHYLLIRRELSPDRRIAVLSADLDAALIAPGSAADPVLMPRDTITVFDLETSRQYIIQPLLQELRVQASLSDPTPIVHIDGRVKVPGDYPLEPDMHISDLIRAGGSLDSSAYSGHAELSRYTVIGGGQRRTEVISVDLDAVRRRDPSADLLLRPFDRLSVKEVSGWSEQSQVTLIGEVRFPGTYSIKRGETLRSVMERAGGLTDLAFPDGAVFTRTELRREEQAQLDRYATRMRTDIAEMALMGTRAGLGGSEQAIGIGQTLLSELQSTKAIGRLVINLEASIHAKPGSSDDIMLRDGDELIIPKRRQEVMVLGEVQDATSHLFHPGLSRDDYIDESGGMTRQADRRQIYIVRANGSVVASGRGWFREGSGVLIHPGDAIVVPLNTEKLPALTLWQSITTILYNIAIAAAEARATL